MTPGLFSEPRPFPGQDPWVVAFEGSLLLIQSTANNRKIAIMRFADLSQMGRNEARIIWAPGRGSDHSRQIWAPELHHLDGRWYVYYAASDGRTGNHRMYVLEADQPLGPYHELGKVCDPLHDTWAIDLTVLPHDGRLYALWSGWEGPSDGFPQNLYIAAMANPWTISGERRLISRPDQGWEMSVAAVNEGPQVLRNTELSKLFIAYSADASWTGAYKMGLLEWVGGDIMDSGAWKKLPRPILNGGGHGCFLELADGHHVVYHRKMSADPGWADREIRAEPFAWDGAGYPVIGQPDGVDARTQARTVYQVPTIGRLPTMGPGTDSVAA
jgi:GH43 family beta-xylosidase